MAKKSSKYSLIWETVKQIPEGKVATYGDVAKLSGLPGQQRLVGYALHNIPRNGGIPWQRVINAQGRISLPERTGAYARQKRLLQKEGIVFHKEKIDLQEFGLLESFERKIV